MIDSVPISVIIPTFNRRDALLAAVASALNQTLLPLEVLVCDDGSTDGSAEAVAGLEDRRVRWLPGERCGRPAGPRNRGLHNACGDWVAFLDDDDVWLPDKLQSQVRYLASSGLCACSTNAFRTGAGHSGRQRLLELLPARLSFNDLLQENRIICSSVVARRADLIELGGFPEEPELAALEDYALWLRLSARGDLAALDLPLLHYRDEPSASLRAHGADARTNRLQVLASLAAWNDTTTTSGLTASQRRLVRRERLLAGLRWWKH